ncbi:hypothetical protein ACLBXB_28540, partial [Methylobacterium mesophilicum]
ALRQRLEADPALANPTYRPPSSTIIKRALRVVADAKEVSHPDTIRQHLTSRAPTLMAVAGESTKTLSVGSVRQSSDRLVAIALTPTKRTHVSEVFEVG